MPEPKHSHPDYIPLATELFNDICQHFSLAYIHNTQAPVELCYSLEPQPGLSFPITLVLQNGDQLHIQSQGLWLSYFPCSELGVVQKFTQDISALLSGQARIVQYLLNGKAIKCILQLQDGDDWRDSGSNTIGTLSPLVGRLFPSRIEVRVVINTP